MGAALLLSCGGAALAQHFDVELRTDKGPVAGSRIVTDFYGDLGLAGKLPIDALTGHRIFPAYFSDFAGGPYATANPGFQAFAGTFVQGEELHFRALGTLLHWTPASGTWTAAPSGVRLTLYGGIPAEVVIGYSTNPAAWAERYAYYQGGTRYDGQGITGPLTAAIDDVKAGGSFHSHLDWKISSAAGTPPAGAYLLTLELWSPTLVGGQPKYLASRPLHIIFERGLTEAEMQAAFTSRISPACGARAMQWTVGANSCSASVPSTASGHTAVATDGVGPATGSATFACSDGNWGTPGNASCELPPPADCGARTLSWQVGANSCSAPVPGTASGAAVTAIDGDAPATGNAKFACTDGHWGAATEASCTVPAPSGCAAQAVTWRVGGDSCSGTLAATPSGSSALATDADAPVVGAASFSCVDGAWSAATHASCAAQPLACPAQTLAWSVGGQACEARVPASPSGTSLLATDDDGPVGGTAGFSCGNGLWSAPAAASCVAAKPLPAALAPSPPWAPPVRLPWDRLRH
ncbi:MAG: hypothetical protein QM788_15675 [Roseateles sp.]|uniref:hypothetical protein n=1 Tax=Roseateles sp. TaxID=1971397 RepID=UPI0039E94E2A